MSIFSSATVCCRKPGVFDVVLHGGWLADSAFMMRKIAEIDLILVASPEYIARHGVPATPADLDQHTVMSAIPVETDQGDLPVAHAARVLVQDTEEYPLKLDTGINTNDPVTIVNLALRGICIAPLSLIASAEALRAGTLVQILPEARFKDRPSIFAVHSYRRAMPPKLKVFLEFAEGAASQIDSRA